METIQLPDVSAAGRAITLAKCYSHGLRRKLLEHLLALPDGSCVGDIYTDPKFDDEQGGQLEQSICSQHLAWLRNHNLLGTERRGKQIIYTAKRAAVQSTADFVKIMSELATPSRQIDAADN